MDSKKLSYVALFGALAFLAYAVHDTRTRRDTALEETGGKSLFSKLSAPSANPNWVPNETMTGDILAANFAQDRRDWKQADMYLEQLARRGVARDDSTALRMMLLALSAGQFDRAVQAATTLEKMPDATPAAQAQAGDPMSDGRDLASLVMMASSVRAGDLAAAQKYLAEMRAPALKRFVDPVISSWLKAGARQPLEGWAEGLTPLQAMHRGMAAEWADRKDLSDRIFGGLEHAPLAPAGAMMVAAYDIRNGHNDAALSVLKAARAQYPQDPELVAMLDALEQGQSPKMRPELGYHLQGVSAGVASALRDLAQMMVSEKAADSALFFAQAGRMIRPDVPGLNLLVGNIFYDQGRTDDAAATFASIQPDDADYVDAQVRLSELRGDAGDHDGAIAVLEKLLSGHPSMRVAFALGEDYRAQGDNARAVKAYDRAIELAGGNDGEIWSVRFVRAMALDELGEWDAAESDLKAALAARPDNPHILNYLGYSWADRNTHLDEAKGMLLRALSLAPSDPYITDSLGWVLYRQGDYRQATLLLERAVSLRPYDPVLNDHLGDVYDRSGRTLEARYQWQRALDYADAEKDAKLIVDVKAKLAGTSGPAAVTPQAEK